MKKAIIFVDANNWFICWNLEELPVGFLIKNACRNLELKPFAFWVLRPNELIYKNNMGTIHFLSDGEVQQK